MSQKISYLLVLIVLVKITVAYYCDLKSCPGKSHTMCKYEYTEKKPDCDPMAKMYNRLMPEEKIYIVELHNELRQKVADGKELRGSPGPQPAAMYMRNLTWDLELELIAEKWGDQCLWARDACRNVARFEVGQNIIRQLLPAKQVELRTELRVMIYLWYDQVRFFNKNDVAAYKSGVGAGDERTDFYTQMIWASTQYIGCAVRFWQSYTGSYFRFLFCNYGPSGNIVNKPVYEAYVNYYK